MNDSSPLKGIVFRPRSGNAAVASASKTAGCLLAGCLLVGFMGLPALAAQPAEPRSQPPWAYTYRTDKSGNTEFMATTPSAEDGDVWLLLACREDRRFTVSLMHSSAFPFALRTPARLALRLDDSPTIFSPASVLQEGQISADSAAVRYLFPMLIIGKRLAVSVPEASGTTHAYSFRLQPSDLALHDIDVHCFNGGPRQGAGLGPAPSA